MTVLRILKFVWNHPLNTNSRIAAIGRFIKWQINSRLSRFPILYPITSNAKIFVWKGLTGATGNLYCGLMEYEDMGFLLHYLKSSDLFIDIGANVGAYTVLASGEINAKSISIEPIPSTYRKLIDNIAINHLDDKVTALNIGLGKEEASMKFTKSLDTVNHVAVEGEKDIIEVQVNTLDGICPSMPNFLKIDVEGFETEVLLGAPKVMASEELNAIIIELNGSGKRYGFDEDKIHESLVQYGFNPHRYDPLSKRLTVLNTYNKRNNTIYIKNSDEARKRISDSDLIQLGNGSSI